MKMNGPQQLLPPFEGEHLKQAGWNLYPPRASPWVPPWLVENIQLTQISPL